MPRPPLDIGTYGKIRYSAIPGGGWRARTQFRDFDGKTRPVERTGKTQGKAAQRLKEAIREWTGSTSGDVTRETKLSDLAALWMEQVEGEVERGEKSPNTVTTYRSILDRHIVPGLGELRVREATVARIDRFLAALLRNVGASSAKTARTVLSGMFGLAARYDAIASNPTRDTRRISSGQTKQPRALEPMERTQWLVQLESNEKAVRWGLPDLSKFMMATGVRIGEALGVFWEDVDFVAGTVEVTHTVVRIKGKGLYRKPRPKTKKSERLLPLPSWALELLEKRRVEAVNDGRGPDSPVFASSTGGLRDPSNLLRVIRETRGREEFLWVTSHTFRKTTATALDDADVPTRLIADQLGHARVSMTQDVYLGRRSVNPATAAALEGLLDKPSGGQKRG
ncbi:site-specific integrase [Amycolatopsis acidiphila]|uniref:Site-specific integrase n=1 Tax=Amycolatopsis acidiphila TaxID=715473 RepID=A0A557ZZD9_9PSEU|nr:site-specific integrase [Amycolatopsis acidiphila]TVT17385.1 site-specific integrase [Amycolatopsis acidiphila]UIJ59852.1 site-specific integrase [Amycolatopsis acidiphila]GHG62800.1 phage integrase [Amycolatopsis acidiphila]